MPNRFTTYILIAMVLGILAGWACHEAFPDPQTAATIAGYISLMTDVFLRLIKMIIAPLVFSTLVVGIAHMGDASVARPGRRQDAGLVHHRLAGLADPRA